MATEYLWRPDFVTMAGSCGRIAVTMELAYLDNATVCARYNLTSPSGAPRSTVRLGGSAPGSQSAKSAQLATRSVRARGHSVVMDIEASTVYGVHADSGKAYAPTYFNRSWLLRTDLGTVPAVSGNAYEWTAELAPGQSLSATVCLSEMDPLPADAPAPPPCPRYDAGPTTANIDGWFAELSLPSTASNVEGAATSALSCGQ